MSLSKSVLVLVALVAAFLENSNASPLKNDVNQEDKLVIEIPQGKLRGNILQSREGRDYYAFYKIPYAQPPTGERRFESPLPAGNWEGIRNETEVAPQCLQKSKYSPIIEAVGEEDCLYVNVYTPKLPDGNSTLFPTLFYIHGGGFTDGNGSRYGGKYFLDEDVVLITFQYRLGSLGFLSSEDGILTGNYGFKDQILALKWVNANIKYFNGDPNRIMIYGNSAGGNSVSVLMVSPMAKGLFHRAISQSGPGVGNTDDSKQKQEISFQSFATEVGCWSTTQNTTIRNKEVLACLKKQNASDLAVVRKDDITYWMTIESYETDDDSDKFMPDSPYNLLKSGNVNKAPWIIGVNSAELVAASATALKEPMLVDLLNKNFATAVQSLVMIACPGNKSDNAVNKAKEFYFGDKLVGNETERNLTNFLSDRSLVYPSKLQATLQSAYSDVYMYYLSKKPAKGYADGALIGFPPADYGASHADELQYIFNYYGYPEYLEDSDVSEYYPFSRMMVKLWVQFAATGKPHTDISMDWEPITPTQTPLTYLELKDNPQLTTVLQSRMEFWDQFTAEELCYA